MGEETIRLALPLLAAGQAQKELFHNEALARLDTLVHGAVETVGATVPPAAPETGMAWILGDAPGGAWAGQAQALAWWSAGGWRFAAPREGMALWVRDAGCWAIRTRAGWQVGVLPAAALRIGGRQVVGAQVGAIADPSGGATVDAEARATLATVLSMLRSHGLIAA